MGSGASLAGIPEDLLQQSKQLSENGNLVLPASALTQKSLATENILAALRRRSLSEQRRNSHLRRLSKLNKLQVIYELPPQVKKLLLKLGIENDPEGNSNKSNSNKSNSVGVNLFPGSEQSNKLVGHIFECIGALQHLVKASQSSISFNEDESMSTFETNNKAAGSLIHEMVTVYTLCGNTIKVVLDANPDAATIEDNMGRLPIHAVLDVDDPWHKTVLDLIEAFPEALEARDGSGRLPIHVILDRRNPDKRIVKLLLEKYPDAAAAKRGVGRVALHYAVFSEKPDLEVLQSIQQAYPEGVSACDLYGRLPLHYAVDKARPSTSIVQYLLSEYRGAAATKDTHHRVPLNVAIERECSNLSVIKALYHAYPDAVGEVGPMGKYPLQLAVECAVPNIHTVHFLASMRPDLIQTVTQFPPKTNESAYEVATRRRNNNVLRTFLLISKHINPGLLKDLNWNYRKIAFLLVNKTSVDVVDDGDGASTTGVNTPRSLYHKTLASIPTLASPSTTEALNIRIPSPSRLSPSLKGGVSTGRSSLGSDVGANSTQVNLFKRLHSNGQDLFRMAVVYL